MSRAALLERAMLMTYEHYDGVGCFDTHLLDGAALLRLALDLDHS